MFAESLQAPAVEVRSPEPMDRRVTEICADQFHKDSISGSLVTSGAEKVGCIAM